MKKKLSFLAGLIVLITSCSYNANRAYQYGSYHFKQIGAHSVSFCGFVNDEAAQAAQAVSKTFVIPETIYGQPVTKIEQKAFMSSTLFDEIIVPKTVTVIGRAAFYNCSAKISTSGNILTDEGQQPPLGNTTGNNGGNGNSSSGNENNNSSSGNNNSGNENENNNSSNGNNNSNNNNSGFEQYAGTYSGTYRLFDTGMSGSWTGQVDSNGRMTFTFDNQPQSFYPILMQTGDFSLDGHNGPPLRGSIRNGHVTGELFDTPALQQQIGSFEGHRS